MVLRLTYNEITKNVAVPLDKDLGSPETSAEIARAFGVSAGRVESISHVTYVEKEEQERAENGRMIAKRKRVAQYENIPLNLNGYDLSYAYNARINRIFFWDPSRSCQVGHVEVKFAIERSFREHE